MLQSQSPTDILFYYFNYNSFRSYQEEIINSIISGNNTLAIMPTGGGKSLCYQIPALILEGTAIVFSPLISLMKDQVDSLIGRGIPAAYINSSLDEYTQKNTLKSLVNNELKLLYIAPERLRSTQFQQALLNSNISFIAVDEAHCISQWGHDFRQSYRLITDIFNYIPQKTIAAFTATANLEVQNDIVDILKMQNFNKFVSGFERENIAIFTEYSENKHNRILELINHNSGESAIIYTGTRTQTEEIAQFLNKNKVPALAYHGGMTNEQRKEVQNQFLSNQVEIIVATNAFGMGIDKPNIRLIIHAYLPTNLEGYYQEIGRAGRDGKESKAYFIYSKNDENLPSYFIASTNPNRDDIQKFFTSSLSYLNSTKKIILNGNLISLANIFNIESKKLGTIIKVFERNNLLKYFEHDTIFQIQLTEISSKVQNIIDNLFGFRRELYFKLYEIQDEKQKRDFSVSLHSLSNLLKIDEGKIRSELDSLSAFSLLQIKQISTLTGVHYNRNFAQTDIELLIKQLENRKNAQSIKSNQVIELLKTSECKSNFILNYFGEISPQPCGKCSSCLKINDKNLSNSYIKLKNISIKSEHKTEEIELFKKIDSFFVRANTYDDFVNLLKMPAAEAANLSQKAIESGWVINKPKFIDQELLNIVSGIVNRHPAMRLSQIRIRIQAQITLPELRITVAYAKKHNN